VVILIFNARKCIATAGCVKHYGVLCLWSWLWLSTCQGTEQYV